MAKHDQRILKFLTQNSDRAPTITDMMTRLNVSISDITASLNSLLAQGLISKRTNGQGIECWFPTGGSTASQGASGYAADPRSSGDSRFAGTLERPSPPEPSSLPGFYSMPQAQLAPGSSTGAYPTLGGSPRSSGIYAGISPTPGLAAAPEVSPPASTPVSPITPPPFLPIAQPKAGVGFLTLVIAMVATSAASVWFAGRLVRNDVKRSSANFVDRAAFDETVKTWGEYEKRAEAHIKALEAETKTLGEQIAGMKSAHDSLQAASAKLLEDAKKTPAASAAKKTLPRKRRSSGL